MEQLPSTKTFEHAFYIGSYISAVIYGAILVVYLLILRTLLFTETTTWKKKTLHLALSTAFVLLVTIDNTTDAFWGEQMWITFRDNPGGPSLFFLTEQSVWYQVLGTTTAICMILLGDALLLYRLFIIYGSSYTVAAFPALIWLAGLALAIIQLISAAQPTGNLFHGKAQQFGVAYYAISIGFNITLTVLIVYRLHRMGKVMSQYMGNQSAKLYAGVSAMLIESAAPYSILGIIFLVPYATTSVTALAFAQIWGKFGCLSPMMIIFRVVTRQAWDRKLVSDIQSHVQFRGVASSAAFEMGITSHVASNPTTLAADASYDKTPWSRSQKSVDRDSSM